MDIQQIKKHWNAYIYNQQENQTDDVEFILSIIGTEPKNILEVCCGGGRILVPLAMAGHHVNGFDIDEEMMAFIPVKIGKLKNVHFRKADAVTDEWGQGYDVVILAGNILLNIETERDNKEAQQAFIKKAVECLNPNGYVLLDFNLFSQPEKFFGVKRENVNLGLTDDTGVCGKYTNLSTSYDPTTQICIGNTIAELILPNGEYHTSDGNYTFYVPTLQNVHSWLDKAGFVVEQEYGDYNKNQIGESTCRAVIWAKKL